MKDDEINIAIAETIFPAVIGGVVCEIVEDRWGDAEPVPIGPVPNYCGDLNAMHCAEKSLTRDQVRTYMRTYAEMVCKSLGGEESTFEIAHGPARQRAEAYLRTLNLWKE